MELVVAGALSFCLDLLLGDPGWIPHPVVWMGRAISGLEERLRRIFPKTTRGEWAAGALLAILLPAGTLALTLSVLWLAGQIHPGLRFFLEVFWGWQALAVRGLGKESSRVYRALREGALEQAQQAGGGSALLRPVFQHFHHMRIDARVARSVAQDFQNQHPGKFRRGVVTGEQALAHRRVNALAKQLRRQLAEGVAPRGGAHRVFTDAHGPRLVQCGQKPKRLRADLRLLRIVARERLQRGGAGRAHVVKAVEQQGGRFHALARVGGERLRKFRPVVHAREPGARRTAV